MTSEEKNLTQYKNKELENKELENKEQENIPLRIESLATAEAISVLGQIAASTLIQYGQIAFFINADGCVEIAALPELSLDALPEESAINQLVESGYDDERLAMYLSGRDARQKLREAKMREVREELDR